MIDPSVRLTKKLRQTLKESDPEERQRIIGLIEDVLAAASQGLLPCVNRKQFRQALGLRDEPPIVTHPMHNPPLIR